MNATTFLGDSGPAFTVDGASIMLTSYNDKVLYEESHFHDIASISLLVCGGHEEYIATGKFLRIPGDIKFIPAGQIHTCFGYKPGTRKINLSLDKYFLNDYGISESDIADAVRRSLSTCPALVKLYHTSVAGGTAAETDLAIQLYQLFVTREVDKAHSAPPLWVKHLRELLQDEWQEQYTLKQLAERIGVHPVTISRYFRLYFQDSFSGYLMRLRVNKAIGLMHKDYEQSLTALSYTCGFADQAHFSRSFKAVTGLHPRAYRQLYSR